MSTQITVKTNAGQVIQSFRRVGEAMPGTVKADVKAVMETARYEASGYWTGGASYGVPEVPGQTYQRTGTYGASFKITDNGYRSFTLSSAAVQRGVDYTRHVGGDYAGQGQAAVHRGRWPLIFNAVSRQVAALVKNVEQSLTDLFNQGGFGL